ncbi:GNAT family N-acetyltransferase [Thioclava sp. GXIMD4215]|uniref:GNAT family N-acetyltransferase n=1 Tax=Thioclava sp. GXIMD4215 TaxID=3131928 RepID=UPI0032548743
MRIDPDKITLRTASAEDDDAALTGLLNEAFPGFFEERSFFKQEPHQRVLAFQGPTLVGQIGIDRRVISIEGTPYRIIGLIDLCVTPKARRQGIGRALVQAAEALGQDREFAILFSDSPEIYRAWGYRPLPAAPMRWLAIDELRSHAVIEGEMSDVLLVKPLGTRKWPPGMIDLLGYMF